MKNYVIAVGVIILIGSLFGAFKSFTSPTEIINQKTVKLLEYQQEGAFDYTVTASPSYFYGDAPLATPEPSPQIPVSFIDSFTLSYSYHSDRSGGSLAINAILESPGAWKKTVSLLPAGTNASSASVQVDLPYFQELADTIEKEIGVQSSSHDLTIQAVVSDGSGQDFVQSLPVKMTKSYIKIDDDLTYSGQGIEGQFDYQVKLKENTLFGAVTLTPPAAPTETSRIVLGPEDTIFTRFIDSMQVNYSYQLTATKPVKSTEEEVKIEAILENPDKWSKTYTLVPPTKQSGDFNFNFPLDLTQYSEIFNTIQQETGVSASAQNLTLMATVNTVAQTDAGSIKETYTQSITTDLRGGLLTWNGDMQKSQAGAIENQQTVTEPARILGLPVTWMRVFSLVLAFLALLMLGLNMLPSPRSAQRERVQAEAKARQLSQKYKEMIVEVKEQPEARPGQTVIPLNSLQDLIKVSQGLLKPVHHLGEPSGHTYWVNDDSTRYEYLLILNGANAGETSNVEEKESKADEESSRVE